MLGLLRLKKNRIPLSAVCFPFAQNKNEPKLCIGYLHSFSFVFLNYYLSENIFLIEAYLFVIIVYIYTGL